MLTLLAGLPAPYGHSRTSTWRSTRLLFKQHILSPNGHLMSDTCVMRWQEDRDKEAGPKGGQYEQLYLPKRAKQLLDTQMQANKHTGA